MKTFVKMILPVAAFALASAGAVATSSAKSNSGAVQGWQRNAPNDCTYLRMCNNAGGPSCKAGLITVFGKPGLDCTQPITHDPTQP